MSDWWYLITMVGVVAGMFVLSRRDTSDTRSAPDISAEPLGDVAGDRLDRGPAQASERESASQVARPPRPQQVRAPEGLPPEPRA